MPDKQIHPIGDEAAPADYPIPPQAELVLKGVFASFDGSGAAGDFKPLLRIVSDAGTVSLEAVADTTVTAGESADVTWFPHLAAAAAPATGPDALPTAVLRRFGTHTLAAGASYPIAFDEFQTTDSTMFKWSLFAPSNVVLPQPGLYQWWLSLYPDLGSDWPAAGAGNIHFAASVTASGPTDNAERRVFAQYPFVTYETGVAANDGTLVTTMGVKNIQNHGNAGASVVNNTAAPWTLGVGTFLYLIRLGDAVSF